MGTLRLFWFFVWRMALWGVSLCIAVMVVLCVASQIGTILMGRGWLGPWYAVIYVVGLGATGAVVGLLLGPLCGAPLRLLRDEESPYRFTERQVEPYGTDG